MARKTEGRWPLIITVTLIVVVTTVLGSCSKLESRQPAISGETEAATPDAPAKEEPKPESIPVTLDGYDPASETTIQEIRLWKDYENRAAGVAGKARHGQKVQMIERKGDCVLIETDIGIRGWVTYYFVKELK